LDDQQGADMKPVSLQSVVNEMDVLGEEWTAYINKKTGELVTVTEEEANIVEAGDEDDEFIPDWQRETLPKVREVLESDDFVALPDKFEIHEYSIMERFCRSVSDQGLQDELLHAIRGSGAFRRFKDAIHRKEVQDDWYRFRDESMKDIAINFLESEGIPWLDDVVS
jgi:hypothetical protein